MRNQINPYQLGAMKAKITAERFVLAGLRGISLAAAAMIVTILLAACTAPTPIPPPTPPPPATPLVPASGIAIMSGDGQNGLVEETLSGILAVQVTTFGHPVENIGVGFRVTTGDGSIASWKILTDSGGQASAKYTLGKTPGVNKIEAFVIGQPLLSPVTFSLEGELPILKKVSGDNQQAQEDSALPAPVVVEVRHPVTNDPLEGILVRFEVDPPGDGEVLPEFVYTDIDGTAMATVKGNVGVRTLTIRAKLPDHPGVSPVEFTAIFFPAKCDEISQNQMLLLPTTPTLITKAPGETLTQGVEVWTWNPMTLACNLTPGTRIFFQMIFGDSTTAPDVIFADARGIAEYDYTFGLNHEPDIVSAFGEAGRPMNFGIAIPWIKVTAIQFDHSPGDAGDGINIRHNNAIDVITPEYDAAAGRRHPAAYVKSRSPVTIKVTLEAHSYAKNAFINAAGIGGVFPSALALGNVSELNP